MSGKTVDRSILQGESIELFRAVIKSPATRDPYERRLIQFLKIIKLAPDDFVTAAKKNSSSIEKQIISFISKQNSTAEKGEITTATVGNCLKAVRLLLEMNDVSLNWKKIRRVLPRARRYALDRIPTVEEIREIVSLSRTLQSSSLISISLRESKSVNLTTSEKTKDITLCSICSFGVPVGMHIINLFPDRSTASSYCLLSLQIRNALSSLCLSSLINATAFLSSKILTTRLYPKLSVCTMYVIMLNNIDKKDVIKTWLAGQHSCTMVISKEFAKLYGLDQPSHVVIEGRPDGILIKRLDLNGDDESYGSNTK
jgi:hypothetical protein